MHIQYKNTCIILYYRPSIEMVCSVNRRLQTCVGLTTMSPHRANDDVVAACRRRRHRPHDGAAALSCRDDDDDDDDVVTVRHDDVDNGRRPHVRTVRPATTLSSRRLHNHDVLPSAHRCSTALFDDPSPCNILTQKKYVLRPRLTRVPIVRICQVAPLCTLFSSLHTWFL